MRVLETQNAVISNMEVRLHLEAVEKRYQEKGQYASKKPGPFTGTKLSLEDTLAYLTWTTEPPAGCSSTVARSNPAHVIQSLMPHLTRHGLTKSEKLMILNLRPTDRDMLEAIIEDIDERFPEDSSARDQIVDAIMAAFEGQNMSNGATQ